MQEEQVTIPAGTQAGHPYEISFSQGESLCTIHVEKGASATVVQLLEGSSMLHKTDVTLEDDATLHVICFQNTSSDAVVEIAQRSKIGANAKVHWHNVTLGGKEVEQDLISHIQGAHSESNVDWIFYGKEKEKQTLSARNVFDAPYGGGEIMVQGVAEQKAHTLFDGMIEITKNGGGTDTYLTESTLMLDATAKVDAIPGLEIKTNDVKASHSATVTKVSEEDLFYFASRGIEEREARKMYVMGFLGALLGKLQEENVRTQIQEEIKAKYLHSYTKKSRV